jgi:hypothetical protein
MNFGRNSEGIVSKNCNYHIYKNISPTLRKCLKCGVEREKTEDLIIYRLENGFN